ncbi:PadR family transcriptional regulator, partial [Clostridioides difficile]
MIRTLILYYLNIKPTHGYEIQKFLQVSGADRWTKIQSGSIYYALAKLEKDGGVRV